MPLYFPPFLPRNTSFDLGPYPTPNSSRYGLGSIELRGSTPFIDFSNDAASDFDIRLILSGSPPLLALVGGAMTIGGSPVVTQSDLSAGWIATAQQNVINGTVYGSNVDINTPQATVVPANSAAAITGRIFITGSLGGKAAISNFVTGAQAGQAAVYSTAVEGVGLFIAQPGGSNGRQLALSVRPSGSVTVYVQVNGYIPN